MSACLSTFKKLSKQSLAAKATKKALFLISAFLVVGAFIAGYLYFFSKPASAAWMDENWLYRKAINVTVSSSSSDITDLETLITVDTSASGKFQSSCQDLRFTNQGGNLLPYYIDSGCGTSSTKVWVMVDLVPKNTTTYTMYMYYGNPSAPAASDSNKFRLFNGLVGYWALNESSWNGTSGEVKDNSVSGNNGVRAGDATTTASGKYSYGGTFDGTGDYVLVNDNSTLDVTGPITLSAWIKPSAQQQQGVMGKWKWTGVNQRSYYLQVSPTDYKLHFLLSADGSADSLSMKSSTTIGTGSWIFVTAVYDGSTAKVYINGAQDGSTQNYSSGIYSSSAKVEFGSQDEGGSSHFNGQIDDARIYNRALSSSEISQLYSNPGNIASNANATAKPSIGVASEEQGPGPVGYWKFDDGQGTNAQDSSSSGNDGTITGATWQTEDRCISGKCLWFDGTNDYVEKTSPSGQPTGNASTTISGWIRVGSGISENKVVAFFGTDTGGATGYGLFVNSSYKLVSSAPTDNGKVTGNATLTANRWYHVAAVYNGTTNKVYVNGVEDGTLNYSSMNFSAGVMRVGAWHNYNSTYTWKGFLDDIKIYPYARSAAQVKTDYLAGKANASTHSGTSAVLGSQAQDWLSNGLVGYWKMDEASGNSCSGGVNDSCDASGNGNDGAWNGDATSGAGKFGNAVSLDGTGDYASLGDPAILQPTNITVSSWFKSAGSENAQKLVRKRTYGYELILNASGTASFTLYETSDNSYGASSTATYEDNTWHHAVGTYNGSSVNLYIDGVLAQSTSTGNLNTVYYGGGGIALGRDGDADASYFNGSLDDVRIYNRALSPKEVSDLYNWAPGPVGYWDFEDGSGATVSDRSGNANNGTATGTIITNGKYGQARWFNNRNNDYVSVPDSNSWDWGAGNFTVEFWIYRTGSPYSAILFHNNNDAAAGSWYIYDYDGSANRYLHLYAYDTLGNEYSVDAGDSYLTLNTWHHVALVRAGTGSNQTTFYVDGIARGSGTVAGSITNGSNIPVMMGCYSGGGCTTDGLKGKLDEVKVYNYARTQKQIVQDMNAGHPSVGSPVGSAIGHWKFDEGQGQTVNNSGSQGSTLNGTLGANSGSSTDDPSWSQAGKYGRALSFDGSTDYVTLNSATGFPTGSSARTISLWFKLAANQNSSFFNYGANSNGQRFDLLYEPANGLGFEIVNAGGYYSWTYDTNWHNLTVVVPDGVTTRSGVLVYFDGQAKTLTYTGTDLTINTTTDTPQIGKLNAGAMYYTNGLLDEIKVYNYALTADEVKLDYNQGKSLVLGATGSNSSYAAGAANQEYCVPGDSASCAAPVGQWDFNEGKDNTCSGGTNDVCDKSGTGNDGAWNGTGAHWTTGKVGNGGKFNGSDDYLDAGSNSIIGSGTSAFAVSFWLNPKNDISSAYFMPIRLKQDTEFFVSFDTNSGVKNIHPAFRGVAQWTFPIENYDTQLKNRWNYYTVVYTGGTKTASSSYQVYVNGVALSVSTDLGAPGGSSNANVMGKDGGAAGYLNGYLDNVRVFNYARSAAQIAYDYNRGAPVGHWKFDECQGSVAHDSTLNGNHGTITIGASGSQALLGTCAANAATAWYNGRTGKLNYSLNLDGTDDYVEGDDYSSLDITGSVSMAAWIYPTAFANSYPRIFDKGDTGNQAYWFGVRADDSMLFTQIGSTAFFASSNAIPINTWTHVAAVYNGSTIKLYKNGREIASGNYSTNPGNSSNKFRIGDDPAGTRKWTGQIDDVRIYNYALTATQVKLLYNNGFATYFAPATGTP